jgi:hypothetical protein
MRTLIGLLFVVSSPALADEQPRVSRLDFVIAESEGGKTTASTAYSLTLREHTTGEIKMGANVPVAGSNPGTTMRVDVGLVLRANWSAVGDALLIEDDVEISAPKDAQTFHKIAVKGNAFALPGKPAVLAKLEDPAGRKHYQVTVTATKVR